MIKPINRNVLIKRVEEEEVKKGSIIIPPTVREKSIKGEVIAVADVRNNDEVGPMQVKIGNMVLFQQYSGREVEIDNEKYLIMKEEDILVIISRKEE